MKKKLLPLAMLVGLAGAAGTAVSLIVETIREIFASFAPDEVQFEAELEQAKQTQRPTNAGKAPVTPSGTAHACDFVSMLRAIGGGSGEYAVA